MKNTARPALVERNSVPQSATVGDIVIISYVVRDFFGARLGSTDSGFKLDVRGSSGSLVLSQPATYANDTYEVRVDTSKLGQGSYECEFSSLPYGVDEFSLVVSAVQQPSQTSSSGVPGYPLLAVAVGIASTCMILSRARKFQQTFS